MCDDALWGVLRACKETTLSSSINDADYQLFQDIANEIAISVRSRYLADRSKADSERFKNMVQVAAA